MYAAMDVESLVVSHAAWLRSKARLYYDDRDDADDLASETIYKCLRQAHRFNRGMCFKPWALAIMQNTYITQYNRRKCVLFTPYGDQPTYHRDEYADQRLSMRRMLSIIRECNRKSCCIESVLLYAKGYSYDEIAERIGIPVGTVKSRISIGRKMLREAFDG